MVAPFGHRLADFRLVKRVVINPGDPTPETADVVECRLDNMRRHLNYFVEAGIERPPRIMRRPAHRQHL